MTLTELIAMTRLLSRDANSYVFTDEMIKAFLNQCISRLKQYKSFKGMGKLTAGSDVATHLPEPYHYMLSLFAASRCLDMDERFYEGTEKRNEFEMMLDELIAEIQTGNISIYDGDGTRVEDDTVCVDYVVDTYFSNQYGDDIE